MRERGEGEYIQRAFQFEEEPMPIENASAVSQLHETLSPYVDIPRLRQYANEGVDIRRALRFDPEALPEEVHLMMDMITILLTPSHAEQIRSPRDLAALLMIDMGFLQQEQMRVVCLDTKNRVQKIHLLYQGSLNTSIIRVGEIFQEPIKLNSAALILAHNHPSSDPTPSPDDVLLTKEVVNAGELLDIEVLDHLVIGQGKWVSMRDRKLGFHR